MERIWLPILTQRIFGRNMEATRSAMAATKATTVHFILSRASFSPPAAECMLRIVAAVANDEGKTRFKSLAAF